MTGSAKRILLGRAVRSDKLGETLLPKRLALPVFASDALSSNAYATQEILLVLSLGGIALYSWAPWVAGAVVLVFFVVVASYRQNVHAYPSGGGDYEVVSTNLGQNAGVFVASALLVDYVLTVAVSISSAVANIASTWPAVYEHRAPLAVAIIIVLMLMNLRGVRESGTAFAIPTYAFIVAIFGMTITAVVKLATGTPVRRGERRLGGEAGGVLRRPRPAVPRAAGVLVGHHGAHRRRGDQQRRPGLPASRSPATRRRRC